jgi:hypothetical protein
MLYTTTQGRKVIFYALCLQNELTYRKKTTRRDDILRIDNALDFYALASHLKK